MPSKSLRLIYTIVLRKIKWLNSPFLSLCYKRINRNFLIGLTNTVSGNADIIPRGGQHHITGKSHDRYRPSESVLFFLSILFSALKDQFLNNDFNPFNSAGSRIFPCSFPYNW